MTHSVVIPTRSGKECMLIELITFLCGALIELFTELHSDATVRSEMRFTSGRPFGL